MANELFWSPAGSLNRTSPSLSSPVLGHVGFYRSWEYDWRYPSRSIVSSALLAGPPLILARLLRGVIMGGSGAIMELVRSGGVSFGEWLAFALDPQAPIPSATLLLIAPRIWACFLSVMIDALVLSIARKHGQRGWQIVLLIASSWVFYFIIILFLFILFYFIFLLFYLFFNVCFVLFLK